MPRISQVWYDLDLRTKQFDSNVKEAERRLTKLGATIAKHGVAAAGVLAAALVTVGVKAAQMAAKLEHSLSEVGTLLGKSAREMDGFRKGVLELFAALPVDNIEDLTKGLYQMISAGVPAERALSDLETAAKAAVGGVTSVEVAVDGITTATNAWARSNLTAEQAADRFFTAVRLGKTTFAEVSSGIGQTAGLAASLGVELDDLLASMVGLTLGGLKTTQAFTSIKAILSNVLKPTTDFKEQFPQLAAEFNRARLEASGLSQFLVDLAEATKGNDQAIVSMFGSVEALNAVMGLTADGGARLTRNLDEMRRSAGSSEKAFNTMAESTANLNKRLRNQLSAELTELGTRILPLVNSQLRGINGIIALLNGSVGDIKKDSLVGTLRTLSAVIDDATGDTRFRQLKDLRKALEEMIGQGQTGLMGARVAENIRGLTDDQLRATGMALAQLQRLGDLTEEQARRIANLQLAAGREYQRRGLGGPTRVVSEAGGSTSGGGSGSGPPPLTPEQIKARQAAVAAAQDALVAATESAIDDLQLQLRRLEADVRATFGTNIPAEVTQQLQLLRDQIAATKLFEPLEAEFEAFKEKTAGASGAAAREALPFLDAISGRAQVQLSLAKEGTAEHERIKKLLKEIRDLRADIADQEADALEDAKDRAEIDKERLRALRDQAHAIESGARGALQLAEAFGLVDENLARSLENIIQIGANMPGALSGDLSSILSVAGGLAQLASSILGDSPAEKRRQEILRENSDAILELSRTLGEFGLNITGDQFGKARSAAQAGIDRVRNARGSVLSKIGAAATIDRAIQATGLTLAEFNRIAKEMGISFANAIPTVAELQQLLEAIAETELAEFANTFTGQLEALRAEFDLFDIDDPIKQLEALRKLMAGGLGAPALAKALGGLDLSTAEGRRAAEAALQALFRQMQAGTLDASALGGMTAQQLLQAMLEIERLIDQANNTASGGQSSQFEVNRSITEITGSRIAAYLSTANVWQQQTAENTALIARILGGVTNGTLQPPTQAELDRFTGAARSGSEITNHITINLQLPSGGMSELEAARTGQTIGEAAVAEIDRRMGERARARKRSQGTLVN